MLVARRRLEADLGSRRLLVRNRQRRAPPPDALLLAVALGLKQAGLVSVFVAADQKLCRVASIEGFYDPQSRAAHRALNWILKDADSEHQSRVP